MWVASERNSLCASANEESDTLVNNAPLTGYEFKFFNEFHYPETTDIFVHKPSSDMRPSYSHYHEYDDYTIGRALSSPLFTQEGEELAGLRQAYHSLEESLLSSQSLSVGHVRKGRPANEFDHSFQTSGKIHVAMERQKEQILAD